MKTLSRLLVVMSLAACVPHIAPYTPKQRTFNNGDYSEPSRPGDSSLYASGSRGLFEDARSSRVGDIIVIQIDESDSATRDDTTELSRSSTNTLTAPASLGLLEALQAVSPRLNPAQLLDYDSESNFRGDGQLRRRGRLTATLPVRVKRVMPNGDLFVEGSKAVLVGKEEQHIYVSGIIRPSDVRSDNSVLSSRVADAQIEYTGRGDVSDQQRPGWFARALGKIWPF